MLGYVAFGKMRPAYSSLGPNCGGSIWRGPLATKLATRALLFVGNDFSKTDIIAGWLSRWRLPPWFPMAIPSSEAEADFASVAIALPLRIYGTTFADHRISAEPAGAVSAGNVLTSL